jgi:pimeloyl-ACP methyl ester carboxylesterase
VSVFSEPGALRAALNWYRAMPPEFVSSEGLVGEVAQPVLYVFGPRDIQSFTRQEVRDLQPQFATGELTEVEVDAGHFLIQERPKDVVDTVMTHLLALTSTDRSMR